MGMGASGQCFSEDTLGVAERLLSGSDEGRGVRNNAALCRISVPEKEPFSGLRHMKFKVFGALGLALVLAACSNGKTDTGNSTGAGAATQEAGPTPGSEADLVANVGDRIFYELNVSQLSEEARATLDKQVAWLQKYPQVSVQIAGNCDDRGTEEYNIALGQRRANAARDYLVAKGVSASRITTISYGKDRPTADGDDESSWAQNRNAITSVR
ncbi:hypothetical protein GCM10007868_23380 [Gluconobacter frateurii]|uniref:Peptidoglycan-associated protein n=2 Tax=Gluconobacter frateurii TaxID=38308 RepID=A0ABQ0Q7I6_9PROT|nr:peptidoglycan-associated lipoprotein [Gluconobacter frateurii NRIC 0228]GLP91263.1 hypothetical protein GCM10007868_23380 [Gluconobacter frateurii]